jgi:nitric oxide reductase subunit C
MSERFTRAAARNIFYGGSAVFLIAFVALTAQSHYYILTTSTDAANLSESVARGKRVWERNACIDCHTLHGEGAYFAPELGNVWVRYGGDQDKEAARAALVAWMQSQPSGVPGRRQMPNFHLSDQDLNDLIDFLEWVSRTNLQGWPPNKAG